MKPILTHVLTHNSISESGRNSNFYDVMSANVRHNACGYFLSQMVDDIFPTAGEVNVILGNILRITNCLHYL